MIIHLGASHPFAEGWMLCGSNNNVHLENINFIANCHTHHETGNGALHSSCEDDVELEHQEEFFSDNNISVIKNLPQTSITFDTEINNNRFSSHFNSINQKEFVPLSLTIKNTFNLII